MAFVPMLGRTQMYALQEWTGTLIPSRSHCNIEVLLCCANLNPVQQLERIPNFNGKESNFLLDSNLYPFEIPLLNFGDFEVSSRVPLLSTIKWPSIGFWILSLVMAALCAYVLLYIVCPDYPMYAMGRHCQQRVVYITLENMQ